MEESKINYWLVSRSILHPLRVIAPSIKRIAQDGGDLSIRLEDKGSDEIALMAGDVNDVLDKVQGVISDISAQSTDVEAATEMMAEIAEQTSDSSTQQQSVMENMATAVEEFSVTIQDVSQNTSSAADSATQAAQEADSGKAIVLEAIEGIEKLAQQLESTSNAIHDLERDSQTIGTVLDVIKSIAEQTNLLALNAAIEAARAGEQGRGFAVVADEVRTLAQRTQQSTTEIENMIDRLQASARNAVDAMSDGQSQAQESVERANLAGGSLQRISDGVSSISQLSQQNALAIQEQSSVAAHTAEHVAGLKQALSAMAEQASMASLAAAELKSMVEQMKDSVSQFKS